MEKCRVDNPATGEWFLELDYMNENEVQQALERADRAQKQWKKTTVAERVTLTEKLVEAWKSWAKRWRRIFPVKWGSQSTMRGAKWAAPSSGRGTWRRSPKKPSQRRSFRSWKEFSAPSPANP